VSVYAVVSPIYVATNVLILVVTAAKSIDYVVVFSVPILAIPVDLVLVLALFLIFCFEALYPLVFVVNSLI
jgi:hypothetical protein